MVRIFEIIVLNNKMFIKRKKKFFVVVFVFKKVRLESSVGVHAARLWKSFKCNRTWNVPGETYNECKPWNSLIVPNLSYNLLSMSNTIDAGYNTVNVKEGVHDKTC